MSVPAGDGKQLPLGGTPPVEGQPPPAPAGVAPEKYEQALKAAAQFKEQAAATAKELADFKKHVESPEFKKSVLSEVLGSDKKQDPVELLNAEKTAKTAALSRVGELEATLKNYFIGQHVAKLGRIPGADGVRVRDDALDHVAGFVDAEGVEVDLATGKVKDDTVLKERLAATRTSAPFLWEVPQAKAPAQRPGAAPLPPVVPPPAPRQGEPNAGSRPDIISLHGKTTAELKQLKGSLPKAPNVTGPWTN